MAGQTRRMSLVEQICNVLTGMLTGVLVGQLIYPLFHYNVNVIDNIGLTAIFTVVSIFRGYAWRRLFNWLHVRGAV